VQLELGGKAPTSFSKTPTSMPPSRSAWAIFITGPACIAGSRIIIHEKVAEAFLEKFLALARSSESRRPCDAIRPKCTG